MRLENQTKTHVWEDSSLCLQTSTKNAVQEFHLCIHKKQGQYYFSIYLFVSLEWAEQVPNEIGAIALEQDGIPAASHDGVAQL